VHKRSIIGYVAAGVASIICATSASAQNAPPTRLRGAIASIDGNKVTIATRQGTTAEVNLADNWSVALVVPVSIAEIKKDSFVGIASVKGPDGTLNALEVLVFPEAARGSNEGHYPWDLQPESLMTNATVSSVATAVEGESLTLTYKGGTQTILVKPGTPIVTFAPGQQSDAKVGAKVIVAATARADGGLTAGRILVGKDGLTPPM
jgi:hypothetical protein